MSLDKSTIWYKNFPAGRFANAAFEYCFLRYLTFKTNCRIVIGDGSNPESYVAQNLLEYKPNYSVLGNLDELTYQSIRFPADRSIPPNTLLELMEKHVSGSGGIYEIDDYFQFDTIYFRPGTEYGDFFISNFGMKSDGNLFQRLFQKYSLLLRNKFENQFIISAHVRRGDYVYHESQNDTNNPFYTYNLSELVEYIKKLELYQRVKNIILLVASDDIDFCIDNLNGSGVSFYTAKDLFYGNFSEEELLVQDISMLTCSDFMICSNSSLSVFSSLLNKNSRAFIRYIKDIGFTTFHPYNTQILIGV